MGGRGSSGGIGVAKSKWEYPEINESVSKIEKAVNDAKTFNKVYYVKKSIDAQENVINRSIAEIQSGVDKFGDEKALITYRRRLRQARLKLMKKGILG